MRPHLLPYIGAGLIIAGLVGGLSGWWDGAPSTRSGWFGHMSAGGHMGWVGAGVDTRGTGSPVADAPEVVITGSDFAFSPDRLDLVAGETSNLTFSNEGRLVHDLSIPEFDFYLRADPGEVITGSLTPAGAGDYAVLCTLPGHADAGMVASLTVAES